MYVNHNVSLESAQREGFSPHWNDCVLKDT